MTNSHAPLRWGILSTARIGRTNWRSMHESGAATLVAVASRDAANAARFIAEMQADTPWPDAPVALGSYEALLADATIEAVYIPLPTGLRKEWVIRAAEAGKHVLCEKPCAVSADDLREMLAACRKHQVRFMDGVMFMHDPRYLKLRELLQDGETIGKICRITSAFSFRTGDDFAATNIRGRSDLEPTGCLGDLGWYCIRAALWAMNWEMPVRVSGRIIGEIAPIMQFSGELDFASGATCGFYCSFVAAREKWLTISGSRANLHIPDFVAPDGDNDIDYQINHRRISRDPTPKMSNAARMIANFVTEIQENADPDVWPEISLKTQIVMDQCYRSALAGTLE
jgi:predicted dehydrogenase